MSHLILFPFLSGDNLGVGGGSERRFLRLFRDLGRLKTPYKIVLLTTLGTRKRLLNMGFGDGTEFFQISDSQRIGLKSMNILTGGEIVRSLASDILHICSPSILHASFAFPMQIKLAKILGIPIVYSLNNYRVASGDVSFMQKIFTRIYLRYVDHIDTLYPYSRTTYPGVSNKISVNYFPPMELPDLLRKKRNMVLFAARFIQEKGAICAVEAMSSVAKTKSMIGWEFLMRGGGPLQGEVTRVVRQYGVEREITVGQADDLDEEYRGTAVFLQLSPGENTPSQSLHQAMASECAVIATDVGNTRAWLSEENAVLVPPESPTEVANALIDLAENPEKRMRLGTMARRTAMRFPGAKAYCDYYIGIWNSAIGVDVRQDIPS